MRSAGVQPATIGREVGACLQKSVADRSSASLQACGAAPGDFPLRIAMAPQECCRLSQLGRRLQHGQQRGPGLLPAPTKACTVSDPVAPLHLAKWAGRCVQGRVCVGLCTSRGPSIG